jgi:hypothetical protein|tara:strand:+ start:13091 stop:14164 length:1074 start_codon:yes stop_codon:yes gene_type:complete
MFSFHRPIFCSVILCTFSIAQLAMASGHAQQQVPNLTGTYDVATLTPLERPKVFGNNLYLAQEQAEKIRLADVERKAESNELSDPNREAPPAGGDGSPGAAGNVGGYNTFWIDNGDDSFAVDGKFRTSILTSPKDGRRPALTPAGQTARMERVRNFRPNQGSAWWVKEGRQGPYDNMELRPLAERCILGFGPVAGPPMFPALYNNVKRIVQTDEHVMILVEMVHDARVIRLNTEHRPSHITTWMGDSIGHWEGDTLVVDTTNFTAKPALYGATENLHVVEKFTREKDGSLNYSFVVDDPTVWKTPWGGDYPWPKTEDKVYEYACHEGNYALGNIMRGARLLEQDALKTLAIKTSQIN